MTILGVILVAIVGMMWVPIAVWRRRHGLAGGTCPAGAPMGSRASARVETLVVAAIAVIVFAVIALDGSWRRLLFDARNAEAVSVLGVVALTMVACGLVAVLFAAWRGAGSIAVVLGAVTLLGYSVATTYASTSPVWQRPPERAPIADFELVIDVSGCNVPGAELWANDVYLGKSPVRIKLSEFLERVPDWKSVPGEPDRAPESTSGDRVGSAIPRDERWGTMTLPSTQFFRFEEPLETALRARKGTYVYIRTSFDGEEGVRTGNSGGGGSDKSYGYGIGFRFPKRDAAIERLLDQARLVDYKVDTKWLDAAAAFGPDAWIAIRVAAVYEPAMMGVFDAWVRRQYSLDKSLGFGAASEKLEEIKHDADIKGSYLTAAPAGRAVELISPLLMAPNLAEAALPIIENTTSINYSLYERLFGQRAMSVTEDGKRRLSLPGDGGGFASSWGGSGSGKQFSPANLVVGHAIWLARQRQNGQTTSNDQADMFSEIIGPVLLPMIAERNIPFGLELADWLGGPAVEKFVLRQTAWTRDSDVRFDFQNRDMNLGGLDINKWVLAAARLRGAAGRQFREAHRDELFSIADQISQHLFGPDDVRSKLDFLFVENARGQDSLAVQFFPRFSDVVRRSQPSRTLNLQVSYLLAMEPAATVDMYVDAWRDYWVARNESSEVVEQLKQLVQLPVEKRTAVLDRLIEYFTTAVDRAGKQPQMISNYVLRELRQYRYGGIDDAASVGYQLEQLRAGPPEGATPQWQRERFRSWLIEHAAARPLLVEALATEPEADFRLFALDAIRAQPTPQYRKLLPPLIADKDESVRTAAAAVETYLDELRASAP